MEKSITLYRMSATTSGTNSRNSPSTANSNSNNAAAKVDDNNFVESLLRNNKSDNDPVRELDVVSLSSDTSLDSIDESVKKKMCSCVVQ